MLGIIPVFWQQLKDNKGEFYYIEEESRRRCCISCEQNETQLEPAAAPKKKRVCIFILYWRKKYIYQGNKNISDKTPKGSRLMAPIEYKYFSPLLHGQVDLILI